MMTIDELLESRRPVLISVERAMHIVTVEHGLSDLADFQNFVDGHAHSAGGMVCAASLYEWLGY